MSIPMTFQGTWRIAITIHIDVITGYSRSRLFVLIYHTHIKLLPFIPVFITYLHTKQRFTIQA